MFESALQFVAVFVYTARARVKGAVGAGPELIGEVVFFDTGCPSNCAANAETIREGLRKCTRVVACRAARSMERKV